MTAIEKIKNITILHKVCKDKNIIDACLKKAEKDDIYEIIGSIISDQKFYGFESDCFLKFKKDEDEYINFLECPEVEEGMFECSKCGSKKIFTTSKQTRRGDEATTVFARCSQCKNGWVVN